MGRLSAWGVLATLTLLVATSLAQDTESVDAQKRFTYSGTIYNRTGNLLPLHFNLYGIPVPSNYSDPDILLTLNATTGGTGLNIYCNPGYGAFADPNGNYPGPGYAEWFSDLSTPVNQVLISKNDPYYKSPTANDSTQPFFICSVINNDANTTTNYTLVANIIPANRTLDTTEQSILGSLYSQCCSEAGSCNAWKAQNSGFVSANGDSVNTDFCSFPNQICDWTGNLYRLHLDSYNLSCPWPGDLLSQFSHLATLTLGSNPLITGNMTAVSTTLANLTSLQFLDLSGDTGLTGSLDSGVTNDNLCALAKGELVSLNLNGIGLTGNIPSCLYSQGSGIVSLDLGVNNFTGSIANTIPVNSSLQLLHLGHNKLTGRLPNSLGNAVNLVDLDTTMNQMTGTIPAGIGAIKTLQSFSIKMNNHTGPIPDSFGTALNLQIFDAKQNSLTALPAAWTNASYDAINSSYVNIRVSLNKIQGPFPAGLVNAQQLIYLILNENNLTGPLPTNVSMFLALRALNASYNELSGSIPDTWGQSAIFSSSPLYLTSGAVLQQVFDLSHNRFTGMLPGFLEQSVVPVWTRNGIFLQNNNLTVDCQNSSFNYLASICPNGSSTTTSSQSPAAAPSMTNVTTTQPPPSPAVSASAPPPPAPTTGITEVSVPPTSTLRSPSPALVNTQSSEQQRSGGKGGGLSGGAVAGIVIGVLVAVALVALVAFFALRRKKGGRPSYTDSNASRMNGGTFSMPTFSNGNGDGEFGRKASLKKGLTSMNSNGSSIVSHLSAKPSGFQRFEDAPQNGVELAPTTEKH